MTALGLFGAVFVDVGTSMSTLWSDKAKGLSGPTIVSSVAPLGGNQWELELRDPIAANTVTLSSRFSGHLPPNLHLTLPHETTDRTPFDLKLEQLDTPYSEKLELKALLDQYFSTDSSAPCPFEKLEFPVLRQTSSLQYSIYDSHRVLDTSAHLVASVSPASSMAPFSHSPISSTPWLLETCAIETPIPPTNEMCPSIFSCITCTSHAMTASLPTYSRFFKHAKPALSAECLLERPDSSLTQSTPPPSDLDASLWNRLASTSTKIFPPTVAFLASVAASEALKIAGKSGTLLNQWLFFDVPELAPFLAETINAGAASLAEGALLFPPSQHEVLDSATFLLIGQGECASEVCKNLALSEICSKGSVTALPTPNDGLAALKSPFTSDTLPSLWQAGLPKFPRFRVYHGDSAFSTTRSNIPRLDAAWYSTVAINTSPLDVSSFSALHAMPIICPFSEEPSSGVDCVIPHISPTRVEPMLSVSTHAPMGHSPKSVLSCFNWATEVILQLLETPEAPDSIHQAIALGARHRDKKIIRWLLHPCWTLEECVKWSVNWLNSKFVHAPKHWLRTIPLDSRVAEYGLRWASRHFEIAPRSLHLSLETDKIYADCVVVISLIVAVQRGLLPLSPEGIGPALDSHGASLRQNLLDIARRVIPQTFEERLSTDDEDENAVQANRIVADPSFDPTTWVPVSTKHRFSANPSQAEMDLVVGITNLRSRCFGLGVVSKELTTLFWLRKHSLSTLPTSVGATSALATIEAIKVLLSTADNLRSSSGANHPFRNSFINLQALEFRSILDVPPSPFVLPNGKKRTVWDLEHFYVPASLTLQDMLDLVHKRIGVVVSCVGYDVNLIWFDANPRVNYRRELPILSLLNFTERLRSRDLSSVELNIVGTDDQDNDVDPLPTVVLHFTSGLF